MRGRINELHFVKIKKQAAETDDSVFAALINIEKNSVGERFMASHSSNNLLTDGSFLPLSIREM